MATRTVHIRELTPFSESEKALIRRLFDLSLPIWQEDEEAFFETECPVPEDMSIECLLQVFRAFHNLTCDIRDPENSKEVELLTSANPFASYSQRGDRAFVRWNEGFFRCLLHGGKECLDDPERMALAFLDSWPRRS